MVTFISSFVFAGVLQLTSSRPRLARQVNEESLEYPHAARAVLVTQDVSNATTNRRQNPGRSVGDADDLVGADLGNVYYACDWSGGAGRKFTVRSVPPVRF